ncbi:response regulator [Flavobacterium sp. RHBU_24]|uniref:response regulator n=1 Tax=Flavobacterium sp. RHBU_24 TaxID=3391185 RepID=UPI0039855BDF
MCNFKNIMLVDDDEDDRFVFKNVVNEIFPDIIFNDFSNADEFISFLHFENFMLPELLFLDINMPVKNGFQVLKSIKKDERLKVIPVVMFSTSSLKEDMEIARKLGADGYAVKPASFEGLESILKIAFQNFVYSVNPPKNIIILHD